MTTERGEQENRFREIIAATATLRAPSIDEWTDDRGIASERTANPYFPQSPVSPAGFNGRLEPPEARAPSRLHLRSVISDVVILRRSTTLYRDSARLSCAFLPAMSRAIFLVSSLKLD